MPIFTFCPADADGPDEELHLVFLADEHKLDGGTKLLAAAVGPQHRYRHRLALRLSLMNIRRQVVGFQPFLVGFRATGAIHWPADKRSAVEKEALSATATDQGTALSVMSCIACRVIHERQPVLDLGLVVGEIIKRLQYQRIEHQNCRKWRAITLRSVRSLQCLANGFSNTGQGMIAFSFFLFCD